MSPRPSPRCRCRLSACTLFLLPLLALLPLLLAAAPAEAQLEPRFATELSAEEEAVDPRCPPQDAEGEGGCALFHGYKWNGMSCEGVSGCTCSGADCGNLFNTLEECQRKFCRCACEPLDAKAEGKCEAILGWSWDGARCQQLVGCSCVGTDCDKLYGSQFDCEIDHQACPLSLIHI